MGKLMIKIDGTKKTLAFLLAITFVISVTSMIVGAADNTSGNKAANNTSGNATNGQVTVAKGAPGTSGAANNTSGTVTNASGTSGTGNCQGSQPTCGNQFKVVCDKGKWKCAFVGEANNTSSTGTSGTGTSGK